MIELSSEVVAFIGVIGSASVAFGVAKAKGNSNEKWLRDVNSQLDQHVQEDNKIHLDVVDRLARIEVKIDNLKPRE